MSIKHQDVENLAHLARLHLEPDELESVATGIDDILSLVNQMGEADTGDLPPLAHPFEASQRLRDDVVTEEDRRDELQSISPSVEKGLFLVPRVIE